MRLLGLAMAMALMCGAALAGDAPPKLPPDVTPPRPANAHGLPDGGYPLISRSLREEGVVRLKIKITEEGRVSEAAIAKSSGFPRLDQAAIEAVTRDWLYVPATRAGKPIAVTTEVNVNFKLKTPAGPLPIPPESPALVVRMGPKDYPPAALAQKAEAYIGLIVVVNEEGKIVMATVTGPSGFPELDQASIAVVKGWKVEPARLNGKIVKSVLAPMFIWSLDPPDIADAGAQKTAAP